MTKVLKLKSKRKDGKVVYQIKKEAKENKKCNLQEEPTTKVSLLPCNVKICLLFMSSNGFRVSSKDDAKSIEFYF